MKLSKQVVASEYSTQHPEKVLQFGTGVLLRALCDFFIQKGNEQDVFNGSIVIVKSTPGSVKDFAEQDNLYTVCVRGIDRGLLVEENKVISAISRVVSAHEDWKGILATAESDDMEIIISNTTEVGLSYQEEKINTEIAPESFIAKLTTWLYQRFQAGKKGVVIIPTELLVDNGKILQKGVLDTVEFNNLGDDFKNWIISENSFCSSLVDRIVPGKPNAAKKQELEAILGYQDDLMTMAEAYSLWAIEGDAKVRETLGFADADRNVKVEKDIQKYRELKLRLLNGSHTLMCGLSYLAGFEYVKDVMSDELMEKYITILMLTELAPAIPYEVDAKITQRYGREVMDRFRNPSLDHKWLSITLQYTMKMRMRCIPTLINYYKIFETVPQYFARGFAAYLLFMKATKVENGKFYGESNGETYLINCDSAEYFYKEWQAANDTSDFVKTILSNEELWGIDLSQLPEFARNVETHLSNMQLIGVREVASALNVYA
ncbi:MAG: tagaturonate reductase [Spirosomaceae bacterium]|nr:tagaturonate reductase [Spirosomataceae bacterium]